MTVFTIWQQNLLSFFHKLYAKHYLLGPLVMNYFVYFIYFLTIVDGIHFHFTPLWILVCSVVLQVQECHG